MKKLKYTKPEAEVVHFHLMDGDLYTLSGGQNGNETGGGSDPFDDSQFYGNLADGSTFAAVCFYVLDKNVKDRAQKIQNSLRITHKNR